MKYYKSYIDRQELPPEAHEKLLNLEVKKHPARPWTRYGALAACAALIIGVGAWKLAPRPEAVQYNGAGDTSHSEEILYGQPGLSLDSGTTILGDWESGFVVNSPMDGDVNFYCMPGIKFPDMADAPQDAACRAYAPGSFLVDLEMEDIQKLFWGAEGIPEAYQTEIGRQDLPWALFWDGYFVHGSALYDGQGQLMELTLYGEKGRSGFELELCQGALPFTCCANLSREDAVTEYQGVEITGWSQVYDRDGDGQDDYICGSEFMTEGGIGVRFTSRNNGKAEDGVDGEAWFNTLFIRQVLPDGLYLDHLAVNGNIPAWREEEFSALAQARQEADFAPYLPTSEPEGYDEFYGRLSYQEGTQNMLFVRWSKVGAYDDVEVAVYRDGTYSYHLVSPGQPETYDLSLYPIPWCDSVPKEYWETVNDPAFRAEDMSLDIVEARGREHDTGGMTYSFDVLHPDGTLVSYRCDGLTARQVWSLVEETLG